MQRIVKPTNFFKKNHNFIMGGFWLLTGTIVLMLDEEGIVGYLYIPLGVATLLYAYVSRNKTDEFIAWNPSSITVKEMGIERKEYNFEKVDVIFVSNNHLTIKSGPANGIILDLKGYEDQDISNLASFIEDRFHIKERTPLNLA